MHGRGVDDDLMNTVKRGGKLLSSEIRKYFTSFYLFNDYSTTKKDLVGKNDMTYGAGSPSLAYGSDGLGEKFDGSKYLVNTSIASPITVVPSFMFIHTSMSKTDTSAFHLMTFGSLTAGRDQVYIDRLQFGGARIVGNIYYANLVAPNDISYTFASKNNSHYNNTVVFSNRSDALGSKKTFVNGQKCDQEQSRTTSLSGPLEVVSIGGGIAGTKPFVGIIYSAGWGTGNVNDGFFKRLSENPNEVIFQKKRSLLKTSAASSLIKFRKTFSSLGTKIGSRGA